MVNETSLLAKQIGYEIINENKHVPVHTFYRFGIYELQDWLDMIPKDRRNRLHFQIEGTDLKVVVRFYLSFNNNFTVKYYRKKNTDTELAQYCVEYLIQYLQAKKIIGNKILVKNLEEI